MNKKLFLSYASESEAIAVQLEKDLHVQNIDLWRYKGRILIGDNWQKEIRRAISAADGIIYLGSPAARNSRVIQGELEVAKMYKKPVYPVFATGNSWADVALLELIPLQYTDIRGKSYTEGIARLIGRIRQQAQSDLPPGPGETENRTNGGNPPQPGVEKNTMIAKIWETVQTFLREQASATNTPQQSNQPADSSDPNSPRNPYKGLRAFTKEDARDFFGRGAVIERMINEIKHILDTEKYADKRREPRFVTVVGPSGSGKSSVVMAGLLPHLQKGEDIPGSGRWILLPVVYPGEKPLHALAQALGQILSDSVSRDEILEKLQDRSLCGLDFYADKIAGQGNRTILLIDQFEELFTQTSSAEEREQFIHQLVTASTEPESKVLVIVTLRADFSDYPMHYPLLYPMIEAHRIAIPPMTIENLHAVIEGPAKLPGVKLRFEENLVGDLLFDIHGQEENLPLLQFTLAELFNRRRGKYLTRQAYEEIGGVTGALNQHAQKTYDNLPTDEHRRRAKALFTRLINPGDIGQDATRRRVPASEFDTIHDPSMQETIDAFINARLITANQIVANRKLGENGGTAVYEISHEALISDWAQLTDWTNTARDDMLVRQTLNNDIEKWEKQPQGRLYAGPRLKEALAWADRTILSEKEQRFLRASKRDQQRRRMRQVGISSGMLLLTIVAGIFGSIFSRSSLPPSSITTTVTNLKDSGQGSLRWAIQNAPPNSTITFDHSLRGDIILTSGDLDIDKSLIIEGPNQQQISITNNEGKGKYSSSKILVDPGANVTFTNVDFRDSRVSGTAFTGAAFINNEGTLTLNSCTITGNSSTYYNGGGIANLHGTLTINNSAVSHNQALGGNGGGIYSWDGDVTLNNSHVTDNQASNDGGGIYELAGELNIINTTTITDNRTTTTSPASNGGGISMLDGELVLNASTISQNTTGGYGGGLALLGTGAMIDQATIIGNTAQGKGGGLAVERDSESMEDSTAAIRLDPFYVFGNKALSDQRTADYLGKLQQGSTFLEVFDDASEPTGSPAPKHPPEDNKSHFLGAINLDTYCQKQFSWQPGSQEEVSLEPTNAESIQCILLDGTKVIKTLPPIDPQMACQSEYPHFNNGVARLADYYDPASWQCYTNEHELGPITPFLNEFCEYLGYRGSNSPSASETAYDWSCLGQSGQQVGIAVTDACQWHYRNNDAFDVLTNFSKTGGWACWAPE